MPRKNGRTRTSTTGGAGMGSAQIGETRTVLTILAILASAQIGRCAVDLTMNVFLYRGVHKTGREDEY